jgi:DNA end-binding protein Ku
MDPASSSPRPVWKGAISFGLVHVPVALYPATSESGIDFDWIDRRTMDPVGYQRINKRSGEPIAKEDIVRGVKVDSGRYVILGDDEIAAAYPKTTQSIEIEGFVLPTQIPFTLLDRPYYLEPTGRGQRVYALLRETLREAGVVGIARVVMHTKEHLAVLVPAGPALMLDTLRWPAEVRPLSALELPPEGRAGAKLKDSEMKMAAALVAEMTDDWRPERLTDRFSQAIHTLIEQRVQAGRTNSVQPLEEAPAPASAGNVVDLTELLARSLQGRKKIAPARKASGTARGRKRA